MEKQHNAEISLDIVIQQLRVPEFNYAANTSPELDKQIKRFIDAFRVSPSSCNSQTIIKRIKQELNGASLPPKFFNTAFFCDRIFDVWIRKASFDEGLVETLSKWRFPIFAKLFLEQKYQNAPDWLTLFDSIDRFGFSWSGDNPRSRQMVLDLFTELELGLFSNAPLSDEVLSTIYQRWHTFLVQQEKRKSKVVSRLIDTEQVTARNNFARSKAASDINKIFGNRLIAHSVQEFLSDCWVGVLVQCYLSNQYDDFEDAIKLTKDIALVFCSKGDNAFRLAPDLKDNLSVKIQKYSQDLDEGVLDALELDIVSLLKKSILDESRFKPIDLDDESLLSDTSFTHQEGSIFLNSQDSRVEIASIFQEENQVLLTNDIGVKVELVSFGQFLKSVQKKEYRKLSESPPFSEVFEGAIKGLERISSNQYKAREEAAEKARREAELLQKQKEEAALYFQQKASEIAEKARNMQLKREEHEALKKKEEYLEKLANMTLGAWVSIDQDQERMRYKLAVKFAATGRYIFVDRLGLKKVEFKEEDLIRELSAGRVEILSDGADFDANLERVVSRLRMSKQ